MMPKSPFDWMDPRRNPDRAQDREGAPGGDVPRASSRSGPPCSTASATRKDKARARLAANLAWDFPEGQAPLDGAALDAIVDRVVHGTSARARRPPPAAKEERDDESTGMVRSE